jgi:threonine aldolase
VDSSGDTLTIPTDAQLLYSLKASRGDDVYGECATTTALEERLAKMTGKEAALFCASGTMTNRECLGQHQGAGGCGNAKERLSHIIRTGMVG